MQAARSAKETLLSDAHAEQFKPFHCFRGQPIDWRLHLHHITRAEAMQLVLDGFFPPCAPTDAPQRTARVALQELGLPYAQDPAITRHLAAFLRNHADAGFAALGMSEIDPRTRPPLPRPDAILLNGGVFNSRQIAERLVQVVSSWWPETNAVPLLEHSSLELAVARGASYYGLVRRGMGRRISGGAAHALFVGMEKVGSEQPMALCVIPRGHQESESS